MLWLIILLSLSLKLSHICSIFFQYYIISPTKISCGLWLCFEYLLYITHSFAKSLQCHYRCSILDIPEGLKVILHLLNAILRMEQWPKPLKQAKVIMILKPGENPTDVTSYRPISLLPIISKILEKLLLSRLSNDMPPQTWIPSHQFGFRKEHSTIHQCHRLTDTIFKAFEDRKYCSAVFLNISQAFDKVWHPGLLQKIQQTLPLRYFTLLDLIYNTATL